MHVLCTYVLIRFRQPLYVALLGPLREILWWWIMLRSYLVYRREGLIWRGRKYDSLP